MHWPSIVSGFPRWLFLTSRCPDSMVERWPEKSDVSGAHQYRYWLRCPDCHLSMKGPNHFGLASITMLQSRLNCRSFLPQLLPARVSATRTSPRLKVVVDPCAFRRPCRLTAEAMLKRAPLPPSGEDRSEEMDWKRYGRALLLSNVTMMFRLSALARAGSAALRRVAQTPDLAVNTAASWARCAQKLEAASRPKHLITGLQVGYRIAGVSL